MLAFLLKNKNCIEVVSKLNYFEKTVGKSRFKTCMAVSLTDNGAEFNDIDGMEANNRSISRCKVFFVIQELLNRKENLRRIMNISDTPFLRGLLLKI